MFSGKGLNHQLFRFDHMQLVRDIICHPAFLEQIPEELLDAFNTPIHRIVGLYSVDQIGDKMVFDLAGSHRIDIERNSLFQKSIFHLLNAVLIKSKRERRKVFCFAIENKRMK